jgi:AcrR family transcriptional regulator
MGRRERHNLARCEHLLTTARRLFDTQGVEATTVRQLADEAGVALRTVYNFFPTKIDLLAALLVAEMREQLVSANPLDDTIPDDPREGLLALIRTEIESIDASSRAEQRQVLARSILASKICEARRYVADIDDTLRATIQDRVAEYVARGALRPDLDPEGVAELVFAMLNGYYLVWLQNDAPFEAILPAVARHLDVILRS